MDDKAAWGPLGTVSLARTADLPKANRALVVCDRQGGYQIEYWRVDADEADQIAEKTVSTLQEVKDELAERFAG